MIIESCLPFITKIARRWGRLMPHPHDSFLDLVAVGNLAVVERFDYALRVAEGRVTFYLSAIAKGRIWTHCAYKASLITVPENMDFIKDVKWVRSLEQPILRGDDKMYYSEVLAEVKQEDKGEEEQITFETLHGKLIPALEQLTDLQREVIVRFCGLDGKEPENLSEISSRMQPERTTRKATTAYGTFQRATKRLRTLLAVDEGEKAVEE